MADDDKQKSTNDDQASKLIEALAPKLAETILPALQKQVEDQIGGVLKKNDELLDKLAKAKDDDAAAQLEKLLAAADQQQKDRLNKDGTIDFRKAGDPIKITKADARDVRKYQAAKKLAAEQGVDLEIVREAS
ncbi:hypothetical protein HKCCE3408_09515 [Rhodobacterales bacterium HKCCE3408]|nr:hypothetical protein [Rhodobacterales bacterium HKCCE3408]